MALFAFFDGTDQATKIRLNTVGLTSSADASPSFGSVVFDDPSSALTVTGWRPVAINEADCTAAPRLFTGYVADRTYRRGEKKRTGSDREIDVTMVDQNAVLGLRIISGTDGKRPAETHIARIDWLLASATLSGLIVDGGLVDRSNPRPMEEADYRGQYAYDVLNDISGPIGRTFFAYWSQTNNRVELFFDTPTATTNSSTLRISNVLADVDSTTTFAPSVDAELKLDPSEIYSRVRFTYKNGTVIEDNTTTASTYISRGLQVNNERVGLETTARSMAQLILTRDSTEIVTITCTVKLPKAKVGLIDAGQRIQCKFSHLPGYTSFNWVRVTRRVIRAADENDQEYYVDLELSDHGIGTTGGGGAPPPGNFPHQPADCGSITLSRFLSDQPITDGFLHLSPAPTAGNLLIIVERQRSVDGANIFGFSGFTLVSPTASTAGGGFPVGLDNNGGGRFLYRVSDGTETAIARNGGSGGTGLHVHFYEFSAVHGFDSAAETHAYGNNHAIAGPVVAGPVTPTSGKKVLLLALNLFAVGGVSSVVPEAGWTEDYNWATDGPKYSLAHKFITSTSGSYSYTTTITGSAILADGGKSGLIAVFAQTCEPSGAPQPGQWKYNEIPTPTPNGSVVTFTTAFPFSDGSLTVFVDRLDQTAAVTSYNGAAGTFTLGFAPKTGELVEVNYQGR